METDVRRVTVDVRIERKHPDLAVFVIVPVAKVAAWKLQATTTVEVTLDGVGLGRRSLKRWDDDRWFIELRQGQLESLDKSPGDRAKLSIAIASDAQRRMLREEVLSAKASATRERRARQALLPAKKPPCPGVKGLTAQPRILRVRIIGRKLPGGSCGLYRDVTVALAERVGCDTADGVPADRRQVMWETQVDVRERNGVPAFRGPAVNGPPHERFIYLVWVGRKGQAGAAMFRRAKLRLDVIPTEVLAQALRSGRLEGRLDLTATDGMPVCGSVRPPAISWSGA